MMTGAEADDLLTAPLPPEFHVNVRHKLCPLRNGLGLHMFLRVQLKVSSPLRYPNLILNQMVTTEKTHSTSKPDFELWRKGSRKHSHSSPSSPSRQSVSSTFGRFLKPINRRVLSVRRKRSPLATRIIKVAPQSCEKGFVSVIVQIQK